LDPTGRSGRRRRRGGKGIRDASGLALGGGAARARLRYRLGAARPPRPRLPHLVLHLLRLLPLRSRTHPTPFSLTRSVSPAAHSRVVVMLCANSACLVATRSTIAWCKVAISVHISGRHAFRFQLILITQLMMLALGLLA
jgi:hypothetical protein